MMLTPAEDSPAEPGSLLVVDPSGNRTRVDIAPVPFPIGRKPESGLVLRDSRVSREHARITHEQGRWVLEDCGSRHGTWVNGKRITRHALADGDRIEFGVPDSYHLVFSLEGAEMKRLMEQMEPASSAVPPGGGNLVKLRAILEVARTLQSSFSINDVLAAVVDAALAITGAERGFLLLRTADGLETRVARHRRGHHLRHEELRVPRQVIHRALERRRELLSMNFDPAGLDEDPGKSIADLELRSVVCVPLVRIRAGLGEATSVISSGNETVGVLYMDSREIAADLARGNREILQTLAIEASTVLENARLLEEERAKRQMDEELRLARDIQQSLLPRQLPRDGWLRAAGSSVASHEVGGDYFDVTEVTPQCWSAVVADVSGKGVSSALLASLLQGALITATIEPTALQRRMDRLNRFLLARTGGEKYATVFYALLQQSGLMFYVNAAQCRPLHVRADGTIRELETTGMPVGLVEEARFAVAQCCLAPGDKLVAYSDGVTEAQNRDGEFFGKRRLRELLGQHAASSCETLHDAVHDAVAGFTGGAPQSDDVTVLVLALA